MSMPRQRTKPGEHSLEPLQIDLPLLVILVFVFAVFLAIHIRFESHYDFGVFYYASHMILEGSRHSLYDIRAQHAFQLQYHRPFDTLFRNPPFALLPILPLAKLPIAVAFSVWTLASFALLFLSLKILESETQLFFGNWPVLLSLAFAPVMASFLHGQFSLIVVACYAAVYALWRRGKLTLGGLVLSVATVKFQLVIGLVAVLLLRRRWRELAGFACGSGALALLSLWMVGFPLLLLYPGFVLHSDTPISELPHMANWQGLLSINGINYPTLLLVLSVGTVALAAWAWKDLERGFAAATLAAMLVSYHLTPQDLSLVLVPFYLGLRAGALSWARLPFLVGFSIVVPIAMVIVHAPLAFLAIPLIAAFLWITTEPREQDARKDAERGYALPS